MVKNPNKHKEPIMGVRLFGRIGKPIWAASAATCGGLFVYHGLLIMATKPIKSKPGIATEAMSAEADLVSSFGEKIGVKLMSKRIPLSHVSVQIDGYSESPLYLCEAWIHYGLPKPGQIRKVMKDAFKLIFVEKMLGKKFKKVLVFSDEDARSPFISAGSWISASLKEFGIETAVVALPEEIEIKIRQEQEKNKR